MTNKSLKSFIKLKLNQEAKFNINDFANPAELDKDKFGLFGTNIDPYVVTDKRGKTIEGKLERLNDVLRQKLQMLGCGSSRCTYILDSKKLIKAAKNIKGIAQNEAEFSFFKKNPTLHSILPTVFKTDGKNNVWMIVELVNPFNEDSYDKWYDATGFEYGFLEPVAMAMIYEKITEISEIFEYYKTYQEKYGTQGLQDKGLPPTDEIAEAFKEHLNYVIEFVNTKIKLLTKAQLAMGDLTSSLENWGITADQRLVLLDSGFTEKVSDSFYPQE